MIRFFFPACFFENLLGGAVGNGDLQIVIHHHYSDRGFVYHVLVIDFHCQKILVKLGVFYGYGGLPGKKLKKIKVALEENVAFGAVIHIQNPDYLLLAF